ncbi:MAG: polysaccharide biosynthesis protein [Arenimonas sp.]|uniref:nucleoside-diphosphate sugar epimerase/dehydratase n=1 Tax=Arenimonas sp. TaxID=1872635 RepID=UPI0025BE87B1|nr:nucleoside-diphosphate sugar epimerase/dehydratase [Arenimonas sp.]MBW8368190.1 polysaccharide biosynthesis protein [Arenimonas sp.]
MKFFPSLSVLLPRLLIALHDLAMVALVWVALRWLASAAGAPPAPSLWLELAIVLTAQGLVLRMVGLYRGLWRFASLPDLGNLVRAALLGVLVIVVVLFLLDKVDLVPRRVLVPYPVALVVMLGVPRLLYRLWKDHRQSGHSADSQRVLVLGAGRTAETLLRELRSDGRYQPVGLLDDQAALRGAKVQGVPVLGTIDDLPYIAQETAPRLIVIAMPSASAAEMQRVVSLCDETGLPFRTVPRLSDVLAGKPQRLELSEVRIEDLLGREPVEFGAARTAVAGKRVMVTGAGGSIGSELARQCAAAGAAELVLFERAELPLHEISAEIMRDFPQLLLRLHLADCGDPTACRIALADGMDFVFHAAACKQVPLLEEHVREALRNNVGATSTLARACVQAGVGQLVFISTDKAICPINVLGASKRFAELACQTELHSSAMALSIVRFGNVLDSAGSVVPLFRRQIAAGGPVTVTHPEVTRYFMTIPEACQLILSSLSLGREPCSVFALDMGRPVAIRELAEQMIRLSGKRPGVDIMVSYTGLRPGEKLHEILFHPAERYQRTQHPRILKAMPREFDVAAMREKLQRLQLLLSDPSAQDALESLLRNAVPEYNPGGNGGDDPYPPELSPF